MKISKIIPAQTGNRVLVKQDSLETKVGGIFIPETVGEKPRRGVVVATSKEFICPTNGVVKPVVVVGDNVMYENHTGVEVDIEGETFVLLLESNIFVVL